MLVMEEKPMLTSEHVARLLSIKERKLMDMLRKGIFPGVKVGNEWRIYQSDLEEYLRENSNRKDRGK